MDVHDHKERAEQVFRDMREQGWHHAIIGTISHSVFSKFYFEETSSQDIKREIAEITRWQVVDCNIVNLANGDVVVTVILKA